MIEPFISQTICQLHAQGQTIRQISRSLKVSRNTVRRLLRKQPRAPAKSIEVVEPALLRTLFARCQGNVVRIAEILKEEHDKEIAYSTLTRLVREAHLRKPEGKRVGRWEFAPGEEMQHDTSPHTVNLAGKLVKAQCAALVYGHSRMVFMQYYPCFTRFEARCFLSTAITYLKGACRRCVIDNTSVILAAGSGSDAVICPEMEVFARIYQFTFMAHRINNPERKGASERFFRYGEGNFLCGREFTDWADLNEQALRWCEEVANAKEKRILGMSPKAAYLGEVSHLQPLPAHQPPIYKPFVRIGDTGGYVNLDTNRYSIPDRLIGKQLDVHKYLDRVRIYFKFKMVADHARLVGQRYGSVTHRGHHRPLQRHKQRTGSCPEEGLLRDHSPELDTYINKLKSRVKGRGQYYFRRLLELKRTYPSEAFNKALAQALHYGLFDLTRLEKLVLQEVAGDFFRLQFDGDD